MPEIVGTLKPPRLSSAPGSPALGQIYYDTATSTLKYWNGTVWIPIRTNELSYVEAASSDVTIPVAVQASALTLMTAPAVTFDGTTDILIQIYMQFSAGAAGSVLIFNLWDGSTDLGNIGQFLSPAAGWQAMANIVSKKFRPSSGSHTFSIRAWAQTAAWTMAAAVGGANRQPPWMRVSRV